MRAIDRRLEKIEKAPAVQEPETWIRLIEPVAGAPESEWDAFRASVAKAEADGVSKIIIRII